MALSGTLKVSMRRRVGGGGSNGRLIYGRCFSFRYNLCDQASAIECLIRNIASYTKCDSKEPCLNIYKPIGRRQVSNGKHFKQILLGWCLFMRRRSDTLFGLLKTASREGGIQERSATLSNTYTHLKWWWPFQETAHQGLPADVICFLLGIRNL